jgi:decaprenylphospho-beta-D-ribofuranose 2-oxidase
VSRGLLSGWGRSPWSSAEVQHPAHEDQVAELLGAGHDPRGTIARGQGRSYGDPAQRAGGTVLRTDLLDLQISVATDGVVTCSPDVTIGRLLAQLVPQGWFVPVTPGTKLASIAGVLAADVHGKNHHADGSWAGHVESLRIVTPSGGPQELTPTSDPELFWATLGGMGLTGVITQVRFRAIPVGGSSMLVDTWRTRDLEHTMQLLRETDGPFRYTVAWLDLLARGASLGRGVLTAGVHAPDDQGADRVAPGELAVPAPPAPSWLLNRLSIAAFNEVWYRKAPKREVAARQSVNEFFYPLDLADGWNRLYGRAAFLQWQVVLPDGQEALLRSVVERLSTAGVPSFLTVLKRFGPANEGPLSFPLEGWTLALDTPAGAAFPAALFDTFDHEVADAGGRAYLAKDARLDPALLPAMYPRLDEWREVAARVDPGRVLRSDLSERLALR